MFCKYLGWCWSWCHFSSCRWQCQWQRTCGSKAAWHTAGTGERCRSPYGYDPSNTANENKQKRYSFQLEVELFFFYRQNQRSEFTVFVFKFYIFGTKTWQLNCPWPFDLSQLAGTGPLALTANFWSRTYHFTMRATLRLHLHFTNIFWLHRCFILTQGSKKSLCFVFHRMFQTQSYLKQHKEFTTG